MLDRRGFVGMLALAGWGSRASRATDSDATPSLEAPSTEEHARRRAIAVGVTIGTVRRHGRYYIAVTTHGRPGWIAVEDATQSPEEL